MASDWRADAHRWLRSGPRIGPRTGLALRAVPLVAAVVVLLVGGPAGAAGSVAGSVAGGLALLGLALAIERLARARRRGVVDAVLAVVGGLVVALVLTGVVLGSTSIGLSATSWTVAVAVLGASGLVLSLVLPARPAAERLPVDPDDPDPTAGSTGRRTVLGLLPWVAIAVAIVVVAVGISTGSQDESDDAPLAFSFGRVERTTVEIVLTSSEAAGPYEVRTSAQDQQDVTTYPLIEVPEGGGTTTATVSLPGSGRYLVTLREPGAMDPIRTLVFDR